MNKNDLARTGLLLVLLVAACARVARPPVVEPAPGTPGPPSELRGATVYRLSGADSAVHILVYRGGALANLGHNHVVSAHNAAGYVWTHPDIKRSGFDIAVPVNELIVDDNAARAAAGADFPLNVPEQARQGTQRNMLSEAVLDGARYPHITLKSVAVGGTADRAQVAARITLKGQSQAVSVPVKLSVQDQRLRAQGEFEIAQSAFGIKPYSVAMGALQVQDVVRVKFDLVALSVD